jgi:hypothetical protein
MKSKPPRKTPHEVLRNENLMKPLRKRRRSSWRRWKNWLHRCLNGQRYPFSKFGVVESPFFLDVSKAGSDLPHNLAKAGTYMTCKVCSKGKTKPFVITLNKKFNISHLERHIAQKHTRHDVSGSQTLQEMKFFTHVPPDVRAKFHAFAKEGKWFCSES